MYGRKHFYFPNKWFTYYTKLKKRKMCMNKKKKKKRVG